MTSITSMPTAIGRHLALGIVVLLGPASAAAHDDPIPETIGTADVRVRLAPVPGVFTAPVAAVSSSAPQLMDILFVVDQVGILWAIDLRHGTQTLFLDARPRLVPLGVAGPYTGDSRGLLGLAFHPNYAVNGLLYTYTSEPAAGPADFSSMPTDVSADHQSVLSEWRVPRPTAKPDVSDFYTLVDPDSRRVILTIDQPQPSHNGGSLAMGPDGMLYVSVGDGGQPDDEGPGHSPGGNGQDPTNLLGTVLRLDPRGNNGVNGKYGVPAGNPFVGDPDALDEIWAYGFRNPWRMSFDIGTPAHPGTGELWLGDVGERSIEEVDVVAKGGNHGWPLKEGSFWFDQNGAGLGVLVDQPVSPPPSHLVDPIAEYDHDEGVSVIGGYVYRGSAIPALAGRYVFGELARTYQADSRLLTLEPDGDKQRVAEIEILNLPEGLTLFLFGFGQAADGELYVMGNVTGTPFPTPADVFTGFVLQIIPQDGPWLPLGEPLVGSGGRPPLLSGSGAMTPGSDNGLLLSGASPGAPALLVVGLDDEHLPFAGGTLIPVPSFVVPLGPTGPGGRVTLPFTWNGEAPAGTWFYSQIWLEDAGAAQGWAASNALQITAQ